MVLTTVGTEEEANRLAEGLVSRRHAACVNVVPISRSVYRWQGKICHDSEYMLVIKTQEKEYPDIEATIQELHSYDLPEILSFNVRQGEPAFLQWVADSTDKQSARDDRSEE